MKFRCILIVLVGCVASAAAWSENPVSPAAPGIAALRPAPNRAGNVVNVRDFGAVGDGVTDDAAAINAAIFYARHVYPVGSGDPFTLLFPPGRYLVTSPINLTQWKTRGLNIEGAGATIVGQTNGKAVLDAMGTQWARWHGLSVFGDATATPSVGIQIGRTKTSAAAQQSWSNIMVYGQYTFAGVYMLSGETNNYTDLRVFNDRATSDPTSCYGLVVDGINHWNVPSDFAPVGISVNSYHSFNENVFVQVHIDASHGCTPVWMANSGRHRWISSYIASGTGIPGDTVGSPYGMILWSHSADDANTQLDLDAHFETGAISDTILLSGPNPTPVLQGLKLHDNNISGRMSVFEADTGVVSVTATNVEIDLAAVSPVAKLFAQPFLWTVSGRVYLPAGAASVWNLPTQQFSGSLTIGATTAYYGDGTHLALSRDQIVSPPVVIPPSASGGGSVHEIRISDGGQYDISGWCFHDGTSCDRARAGQLPTVTIAAPVGGGTQATARVMAVKWVGVADPSRAPDRSGFLPYNPGIGYRVGDILTVAGGIPSGSPLQFQVRSVDPGGAVTDLVSSSGGIYNAIPAEPAILRGGHGSNATMRGLTYKVESIKVTNPGAGYHGRPAVMIEAASFCGRCTATAVAIMSTGSPPTNGAGWLPGESLTGPPGNSHSVCTSGQIRIDASHIYICVAANSWKRATLDAW